MNDSLIKLAFNEFLDTSPQYHGSDVYESFAAWLIKIHRSVAEECIAGVVKNLSLESKDDNDPQAEHVVVDTV